MQHQRGCSLHLAAGTQVHLCVLAALPEAHGTQRWLHGSLNSS